MLLKEWLFKTQITQVEFARKIGISRQFLVYLLNGSRHPSPKLAKRIEEATGGKVTVLELLFPEDYPSPFIKDSNE